MMQLKTKYQKTCQWPSELPQIFLKFKKKVPHITKFFGILCFGILPDNRHTNIQKTTRLNVIIILIFYQPPKLPSLITKKMMKVFLWRPTWAHFYLELFWQWIKGKWISFGKLCIVIKKYLNFEKFVIYWEINFHSNQKMLENLF
jgi:hypothetical protein